MVRLSKDATDEQILDVLRDWIELLAQDKYNEAFEMFRYGENSGWTPEHIRTWINNCTAWEPWDTGEVFKVTSLKEPISGKSYNCDVNWWDSPPPNCKECKGVVYFDLPLNGEWSDITAMFDIIELDDCLILELDDIHIL